MSKLPRPTTVDPDFGATDPIGPVDRRDETGSPRGRRLKIFFDGGCRPNPGRIEVAVVARGATYYFDDLGFGTSSDSEWLALRLALSLGQSLAEPEFDLIGDCANVVAQANGSSPCRTQAAAEHRARFHEAASSGPPRRIRWIARTRNLAGIALARRRRR
jgi:ribonuclease HI